MITKTKFLVPIDFTEVTEDAFVFALDAAKYHKTNIVLLHIISDPNDRIGAEQKLNQLIAKHVKDNSVEVDTRVVIGKVLTDIGVIADSIGVDLVVMGTHSTSMWQKIFGSPAMSVVSNSNVPIILTQKNTEFAKIKNIVMTLNLAKESIQVVKYAAKIAKMFNSQLFLVARKYNDENFMKKININLILANSFLKEEGLNADIELLDDSNFERALLDFCKQVDANLLAATYYPESFQLFSANLVQELAGNELGLPVMTFYGEDSAIASNFGFITQ
jgi:nucleotide-binding universal stress UspA family protein